MSALQSELLTFLKWQLKESDPWFALKVHCYYRPQTKLRKGNVFEGIVSSLGGGGSHVTITYDALDLTV